MSPSGRMTAPLLKDLFVLSQLTSSLQFFLRRFRFGARVKHKRGEKVSGTERTTHMFLVDSHSALTATSTPAVLFAQGVTDGLPPVSASPVIGQVALSARSH